MSRVARRLSETGMYHIIFRGINRQNIFEEPVDYEKMKEILRRVKTEMEYEMYAYCLMTNHVHLFIKEKNVGEISKIMTKILSHYATWFNKKYDRSGALFSNRYKSEPVEDDRYFIGLTRYIHQNPVKAGMTKTVSGYYYSSYSEYVNSHEDLINIDFMLEMLHEDRDTAIKQFKEINSKQEKEVFEITDSRKNSTAIRRLIITESEGLEPEKIKALESNIRDALIRRLVLEKGISKSALGRATGISRSTIIRVCKNEMKQKMPRPQNVSQTELPAHLM